MPPRSRSRPSSRPRSTRSTCGTPTPARETCHLEARVRLLAPGPHANVSRPSDQRMPSSAPMPARSVPVFDGHNDALLRLMRSSQARPEEAFLAGEPLCHLDLPRARAGGFAGGLFAIYVPDPHLAGAEVDAMMARPRYDVPLPPMLEPGYARDAALAMMAI